MTFNNYLIFTRINLTINIFKPKQPENNVQIADFTIEGDQRSLIFGVKIVLLIPINKQ